MHNQLQAPIYRNMINYAWYAAKLIRAQSFLQIFIKCLWCCKLLLLLHL
jgi:hypothetical protein